MSEAVEDANLATVDEARLFFYALAQNSSACGGGGQLQAARDVLGIVKRLMWRVGVSMSVPAGLPLSDGTSVDLQWLVIFVWPARITEIRPEICELIADVALRHPLCGALDAVIPPVLRRRAYYTLACLGWHAGIQSLVCTSEYAYVHAEDADAVTRMVRQYVGYARIARVMTEFVRLDDAAADAYEAGGVPDSSELVKLAVNVDVCEFTRPGYMWHFLHEMGIREVPAKDGGVLQVAEEGPKYSLLMFLEAGMAREHWTRWGHCVKVDTWPCTRRGVEVWGATRSLESVNTPKLYMGSNRRTDCLFGVLM